MATNQYFNKFKNTAEQRLVEDLVVESIKIHGVDCVYIPRSLVNVDEIFGEDRLPKFENGRDLEMYVDSYDGFEGEGEVMSQFGLEIKDEITLTLAKKRFSETFADKNYPYPREGDLVYFPLSNGLFEINFVEREQNFFNFGKTFTFQIKCSMFVHSGEDIESGWDQIDGATSDVYQQMLYVKLGSTGSGTFTEGENAFLYDGGVTGATMSVVVYDSTTSVIEGTLLSGSITGVDSILGESSGATYELDSIGFTQDYFVKDPFEDNTNFQFEGSTFLDFTDTDPFSEGDL
jgi:hypothetical protein